ncbi:hypothetical protein TNCV_2611791 [Trichonephila clavipes]|nr:hypothetical protein TNCV_2611791 [Trichonephila clavipes]
MIVCPKKLLPTLSHLVKLLYAARQYKCRIGPLAGAPPDTCAVVISMRLNRDSSLKMTRLQSVTLKLPEVGKNPVDTAYDFSGKRLSGRRLLKPIGQPSPYGFS